MKSQERKVYDAYRNMFSLMANRGYTPEEGHEMQEFEDFKVTLKTWESDTRQFWIVFERDTSFVDVCFPGTVDKKQAESVIKHLEAGGTRGSAKRDAYAIIIYDTMTPPGQTVLMPAKKQSLSRTNHLLTHRLEFFSIHNMQINPLLHARQPEVIHLITDEALKEELRKSLVAASNDKNATLAEMLPIIYVNNPLSVWFDAYVGDVFYFVRHGKIPYFRIVQPDPMIDIGAKKSAMD